MKSLGIIACVFVVTAVAVACSGTTVVTTADPSALDPSALDPSALDADTPDAPLDARAAVDSATPVDAGLTCNTLENSAPLATLAKSEDAFVAPSEDVIDNGTYYLTTIYYDTLPATPPPTERQTLRFTSKALSLEVVSQVGDAPEERTNIIAFETGETGNFCPPTPLWPFTMTDAMHYSAGHTRLVLYPKSGVPYAYAFTKQPGL